MQKCDDLMLTKTDRCDGWNYNVDVDSVTIKEKQKA